MITGQGINTLSFGEGGLSTHNLFMFLYLEGGILFVVLFLIFMYLLWKKYFEFISDKIVCMSAAFMLGTFVLVSFELLLLINNIVVSMWLWFVIAFGLIRVNYLKQQRT